MFMKDTSRLFRFMLQFGIDRFKILMVTENSIRAIVGWPDSGQLDYDPDDEIQEIVWDVQNLKFIDDALAILELAFSKGFFDSDKLCISENDLWKLTGWEKNRFYKGLQDLLKIKVDIIDNGKKTDYFFVHF